MSEPKVEPWMRALALGLAVVDWDAGKVVVGERDGYRVTEPTDQLIDGVAKLIASQIPMPVDQPIRRGDVVQVVSSYNPAHLGLNYTVVSVGIEKGMTFYKGSPNPGNDGYPPRFDAERLIRIGRAKFYPDGTPVED